MTTANDKVLYKAAATQEIEYLRRLYALATDQLGINTQASITNAMATYRRIFTPDVSVRVTGEDTSPLTATGPDAWAKVATEALADYIATQHLIGTQLVEIHSIEFDDAGNVTSGEASMSSYLQAWHADADDNLMLFIGTYYDKVRFSSGFGWQIYDMELTRVSGENRALGVSR
jgi:hypothetical protein